MHSNAPLTLPLRWRRGLGEVGGLVRFRSPSPLFSVKNPGNPSHPWLKPPRALEQPRAIQSLESRLQPVETWIAPEFRLTKFNQIAADSTKYNLWDVQVKFNPGGRASPRAPFESNDEHHVTPL